MLFINLHRPRYCGGPPDDNTQCPSFPWMMDECPRPFNSSFHQIKRCQLKRTKMYISTYWARLTGTRAYIDQNPCQFAANISLFYSFCTHNGAADKTYTVDTVLLSAWQCSLGSRPSTNYCPTDGLFTIVAGRLSSKPLIGIRSATSSKLWKFVLM